MPENPNRQNTQKEPPSVECPYGPEICKGCQEEQYPYLGRVVSWPLPEQSKKQWYPPDISISGLCPTCEKKCEKRKQLSKAYAESGLQSRHRGMTFESFKIPNQNFNEAIKFLKDYAQKETLPTGNLYISGPVGVGKTHLACAAANLLVNSFRSVIFKTSVGLLHLIKSSFNENTVYNQQQILWNLCDAELLIIDDLGVEKQTDWVKEIIYYVIDERYNRQTPILVTSNFSLEQLSGKLDDRIASRLSEGRIIKLEGKDYRPGRV